MIQKIIYLWALLTISLSVTAQTTQFKDDFVDKSPHKSAFLTVNGVKLHYLDWGGKGKSLLFLTGMGNSAHIYDDLAPKFIDEFRVLALTRRGHGQSDKPETGYDTGTLTEDVRQFLDALKIERVTLTGHSLAGDELTRFAGLYPERVDKLVYLDAAYDHSVIDVKALMAKTADVFALIKPSPKDLVSIDTVRNLVRKQYGFWSESQDADLRQVVLFSPEGKPIKEVMSDKIVQSLWKGPQPPDYSKVKAPALSFYGLATMASFFPWVTADAKEEVRKQAQDFLHVEWMPHQRKQIERFQKEVASGRVIEMPNTHHYCFLQKQDEVVREMRAFLLGK